MLLDQYQELAVKSPPNSNLRVIGSPGSGKTRTLTMRYSHLVLQAGLKPSRILVLTFSKKAAEEMSKRIREMLDIGPKAKNQISTINAFCHRLYNDWRVSGNLTPLKVWQYGDKQQNPAFKAAELIQKHMKTSDLSIFDSINKTLKSWPEPSSDLLSEVGITGPLAKKAFNAWGEYETWMKENNLTDFYGQVWNVDRLMYKNPFFAKMIGQRFDKIMCDEVQDTFPQSYRILLKLARESSIELYGDPSQSIYGFNGAAPNLFYEIENKIPNLITHHLSNNYRSYHDIVNVVNNFGPDTSERFKLMECVNNDKPGIVNIQKVRRVSDQADYIANEIKEHNLNYGDVFVLARTNGHCSTLYQRLLQLGIPANYAANFSIWDKTHIKAGIGYMAVVNEQDGPDDLISILNIPSEDYKTDYSPTRFLSKAAFAGRTFRDIFTGNFNATGRQRPGISNMIRFVEQLRGLDDNRQRMGDIGAAISKWAQFSGKDHFEVEDDLAMLWDKLENVDYSINNLRIYIQKMNEAKRKIKSDRNKVEVMTIHQVKGLEALYVFVTGLSEPINHTNKGKTTIKSAGGNLGFHPGRNTNPDINEENCLYYVGISRAIERLYLTYYEQSGDNLYELSSFVSRCVKRIAGFYDN